MTGRTRDWRQFPPYYFTILDQFAEKGELTLPKLPERQAQSRRRDLHHFLSALSKSPLGDAYARNYEAKAKHCQILVGKPDEEGMCEIKLITNPLSVVFST